MWHGEISAVVLRHYERDDGYDERLPFTGVAFVKMLGQGECFIEGALRTDGRPLGLLDWRDLGCMLYEQFGVRVIRAKRNGRDVSFNTERALRDTGSTTTRNRL